MPAAIPFRRSYWVEPHRLLAGFLPGDKDPITATAKCSALIGAGIRLVINLMEESEPDWHGHPFVPYDETLRHCAGLLGTQASMLRFPIRDVDIPSHSHMSAILDAIDHGLASGGVYVHCRGGRGRSNHRLWFCLAASHVQGVVWTPRVVCCPTVYGHAQAVGRRRAATAGPVGFQHVLGSLP